MESFSGKPFFKKSSGDFSAEGYSIEKKLTGKKTGAHQLPGKETKGFR
ncbi:MAG TPA: hypothetical protein VIU33_09095 [Nitrospiria bacterium]